jgi:hypothetical protein
MGILESFFGFTTSNSSGNADLPELFPLKIKSENFVDIDVINIYSKILTDCIERIQGIPDKVVPLLWDNFLQNESPLGLITLIANAMSTKGDLFLIYDEGISLLRLATPEEEEQIEADYVSKGSSDLGIYVSFEYYQKSDMVKIYSAMEYCVIASMNKMMNLSKSIQYKMSDMRKSVSLSDAYLPTAQAMDLANSLRSGKDIIIDKNDEVVTNNPDISSIKESISFLDSKRSFYYGMPLSYINGEQTPGIGSTGEADTRAVERGLKQYYISILKPILEALFEINTTFKSNDFRQIGTALEAIKAFELVSDDLLSRENKQLIIAKLFDVDFNPDELPTERSAVIDQTESQFQIQ